MLLPLLTNDYQKVTRVGVISWRNSLRIYRILAAAVEGPGVMSNLLKYKKRLAMEVRRGKAKIII
jgi:hypothetical protein